MRSIILFLIIGCSMAQEFDRSLVQPVNRIPIVGIRLERDSCFVIGPHTTIMDKDKFDLNIMLTFKDITLKQADDILKDMLNIHPKPKIDYDLRKVWGDTIPPYFYHYNGRKHEGIHQ